MVRRPENDVRNPLRYLRRLRRGLPSSCTPGRPRKSLEDSERCNAKPSAVYGGVPFFVAGRDCALGRSKWKILLLVERCRRTHAGHCGGHYRAQTCGGDATAEGGGT